MTARDWLGNSIIDRTTGDMLGRVIRLMAAPDRRAAIFLVIRPADPCLPLMALPWEKAVPGKPALADTDAFLPLSSASSLGAKWENPLPLGMPGFSEAGSSLGRCCDAVLAEDGKITDFLFSSGTSVASENIACIGNAAIIQGSRETPAEAIHPPLPVPSPLLGRIVTRQITRPDGRELARQGQVVDAELLAEAERSGRIVALTLHTKPSE